MVKENFPDEIGFIASPWRFPLHPVANQPELFAYKARNGKDGVCLIERIDLPDERIVVACIEIAGNPGCSITNSMEDLCFQVGERFDIPADRLVWLEHYDYYPREWHKVIFGQTVQVQFLPDTQFPEQHDLSRYDIGIIHLLTVSGNRNHRRQFLGA